MVDKIPTTERPQKQYYDVHDIMAIVGTKQNWCYELIRKLRADFTKEYNAPTPQGRIPIWYFEERMRIKKPKQEE